MSNRWTGDYDAVLAVTTAGLDRLLAAQHADGSLFHRQWLPLPLNGRGPDDAVRGDLGTAVSPPGVGVPDDPKRDRLAVSFDLRGYLLRHPESPPAPEFVHGRLSVEAPIRWVSEPGEALVEVDFRDPRVEVNWRAADDSPFATDADGLVVRRETKRVLRQNVRQVQQRFDLPPQLGIQRTRLRTYAAAAGRPAGVGLLLDFADRPHGDGDHLEPESFLGGGGGGEVALALGREMLNRTLHKQAGRALTGFAPVFEVDLLVHTVDYRVVPDLDSLAVRLEDGTLRVSLSGTATTGSAVAPDVDFSVAQTFSLALAAERLVVAPSGDASVELHHGLIPDAALNLIERRAEDRLEAPMADVARQASEALNAALAPVERLLGGLGMPGLGLRFEGLTVDADAVVVSAGIELPAFPQPVARYTAGVRRGEGGGYEGELRAQPSWIPGGTIERYRWGIFRTDGELLHQTSEPHTFVLRLATQPNSSDPLVLGGAWPPAVWCLEIEGTQASPVPGGRPVPVRAGYCPIPIPGHGGPVTHPAAVIDVTGGGGDDGTDSGPIVVGSLALSLGLHAVGVPVLVFNGTSGQDIERSYDALDKALLLAVLEHGAHAAGVGLRRIDDEAKRNRKALASAVDPGGRWAMAAGVEPGNAVLYDAGGKEVWREKGDFDPVAVMKEIVKATGGGKTAAGGRLVGTGGLVGTGDKGGRSRKSAPTFTLATAKVRRGEAPPEITLRHLGRWMPLRKLTGKRLVVCFWAPFSKAAVAELASRVEDEKNGGPQVVAVHMESHAKAVDSGLHEAGLGKLSSLEDRGGRIAQSWGIRVWPTTVEIGRDGKVASVGYGRRRKSKTEGIKDGK